jgi:hypothetical protein
MEPYSANKLMLKNTLALVGDRGIVEEGRSEKEKKKRKRGKEMEAKNPTWFKRFFSLPGFFFDGSYRHGRRMGGVTFYNNTCDSRTYF